MKKEEEEEEEEEEGDRKQVGEYKKGYKGRVR